MVDVGVEDMVVVTLQGAEVEGKAAVLQYLVLNCSIKAVQHYNCRQTQSSYCMVTVKHQKYVLTAYVK